MKNNTLGYSDIKVSEICLGSMTWGTQNTESEGHEQMDYAVDHGVNFIDTAEMYPVNPMSVKTAGRTEQIVGSWLASRKNREKVIIATKVSGPGTRLRDDPGLSRQSIFSAVEGSLKRLQTDFIDLYQIHWSNRSSYHFRQSWEFDPTKQNAKETKAYILEALEAFDRLIADGKVRAMGLSNESCWGTSQFLSIAKQNGLPTVVSIQNEYSLLDRKFDLDLAELSINENVGLLSFSPMATGILSGKYQGDKTPPGSRRTFSRDLGGRYTQHVIPLVDNYISIAAKHNLDPCQMAVAFCCSRPFMASTIIGSTTMEQLKNAIASVHVDMNAELLHDLNAIHQRAPNPMG